MKTLKMKMNTSIAMAFLAIGSLALTSCANVGNNTSANATSAASPAKILSDVTWKTTVVKNQKGEDVTAANGGYVGFADYRPDGRFEIRGFDNVVRSSGTWALTPDGKKRILVTDKWSRVVDILVLNKNLFTYRITNGNGEVVDVEHVPAK